MSKATYKEDRANVIRLCLVENNKESNGKIYPDNRIFSEIIPWEFTNEEGTVYTGKKLRITVQKMQYDRVTQEAVVVQKAINGKAVPDQKVFECPIDHAKDFLQKTLDTLDSL